MNNQVVNLKVEAKFERVTVTDLVEYFTNVEKRMQWDGTNFETMQEVLSYPIKTTITYIKMKQAKGQPARDALMLSHKIELVGDRVYLLSGSVQHP